MNRFQALITLIAIFPFSSCNTTEKKEEDSHVQESILADYSFKDSNFVLTDFKQGAFNIKYRHDTLGLMYNSWMVLFSSIPHRTTADTSKWIKPYEYCGSWQKSNMAGYRIVSLKNNYIKKTNLNIKDLVSYDFDWQEIHKDKINGFISFSDTFSYVPDYKLIGLNIYSEGKYTYTIYQIPKEYQLPPEKLKSSHFILESFEPEFENGKIKNIKPNVVVIP